LVLGYRDTRTRDFAAGKRVKELSGIERTARLKLDRRRRRQEWMILLRCPGNRFEALVGDRKEQYRIRINGQWRICSEWPDRAPGPSNVEIVDYH
jgi:proteic killer suppression protein